MFTASDVYFFDFIALPFIAFDLIPLPFIRLPFAVYCF
jgi:hypothetical protein